MTEATMSQHGTPYLRTLETQLDDGTSVAGRVTAADPRELCVTLVDDGAWRLRYAVQPVVESANQTANQSSSQPASRAANQTADQAPGQSTVERSGARDREWFFGEDPSTLPKQLLELLAETVRRVRRRREELVEAFLEQRRRFEGGWYDLGPLERGRLRELEAESPSCFAGAVALERRRRHAAEEVVRPYVDLHRSMIRSRSELFEEHFPSVVERVGFETRDRLADQVWRQVAVWALEARGGCLRELGGGGDPERERLPSSPVRRVDLSGSPPDRGAVTVASPLAFRLRLIGREPWGVFWSPAVDPRRGTAGLSALSARRACHIVREGESEELAWLDGRDSTSLPERVGEAVAVTAARAEDEKGALVERYAEHRREVETRWRREGPHSRSSVASAKGATDGLAGMERRADRRRTLRSYDEFRERELEVREALLDRVLPEGGATVEGGLRRQLCDALGRQLGRWMAEGG